MLLTALVMALHPKLPPHLVEVEKRKTKHVFVHMAFALVLVDGAGALGIVHISERIAHKCGASGAVIAAVTCYLE